MTTVLLINIDKLHAVAQRLAQCSHAQNMLNFMYAEACLQFL